MFGKILIANRGEIACRIIRTAARLGVRTAAVFSEADAAARHVALADEAFEIGPAPAAESYLCGERIVATAQRCGAEAIHPGYGFLSENADFARACAAAAIAFIGPPADAIAAMGSKRAAKEIMAAAGVPVVPGYHGDAQSPELLAAEAGRIGYPVLIKASAGGGGKGMRVVRHAREFSAALVAAKREAAGAFGDDSVLLERYLGGPRHIEIQVFCDRDGRAVHLFERDCSIQRRHQKIIEEAPAPGMEAERRAAMGAAALAAARAIGYVGAGTVEFIVDADARFYFMEMNTRLQVEHPVTELISAQDLVEWQLRVAAGEPLPCSQAELAIGGHAIEARIYAEDPDRDFLPATGHVSHLRFPSDSRHIRIDSGIREGDAITIHYDPMIAKLIVWDRDRRGALRRLGTALGDTQVVGVSTNLDLLASIAAHPEFQAGTYDTGFVEAHRQTLLAETEGINDTVLALACLEVLLDRSEAAARAAARSQDPFSPWHLTTGWRLNQDHRQILSLSHDSTAFEIPVQHLQTAYRLDLPNGSVTAEARHDAEGELQATLNGTRMHATVVREARDLVVFMRGGSYRFGLHDPGEAASADEAQLGALTAPMPGRIVAVMVAAGAHVERGAPLLILEAMKMEHTIAAPSDGTVTAVHYRIDDVIEEGSELLSFEPDQAPPA